MTAVRILVTAARMWTDVPLLTGALDKEAAGHEQALLIHGRCDPRNAGGDRIPWDLALAEPWRGPFLGGDWHAHHHAVARGWTVSEHPANWKLFGKAAGGFRNQQMVDLHPRPDVCVAAVLSESVGTYDCMRRAKAAGIRVVDITRPEPEGLW